MKSMMRKCFDDSYYLFKRGHKLFENCLKIDGDYCQAAK
jgi:hypothetical protein